MHDTRRGTSVLEPDSVLPSQPTLSWSVGLLSGPTDQEVVREGIIEHGGAPAVERQRGLERLMIDLEDLPFEVHGQQAGSEYNGYYGQRIFMRSSPVAPRAATLGVGSVRRGRVRP